MTKDNYTTMSNQQLLEEIQKLGIYQGKLNAYLKRHYHELFNELVSRTHFLDDFYKEQTVPMPARLYCLEHNLKEQPRCQNPSCPTHAIVDWCRGTKSFRQYCSVSCHNSDPNFMDKIEESNMKRYGVKCTLQLESVKEKSRETNIKNLGVPYPMQSKEVQEKAKNTNFSKLGVEWTMQSNEIREKAKQTLHQTLGVDNPMQSKIIQQKSEETMLKNHGVRHYAQTLEFHKTTKYKFSSPKYPDMSFESSWEFEVYDFLTEHKIAFEYHPSIRIPYKYGDKVHTYHPDFFVNGKIYEVKGDNFFRINKSTGQEEMYCPWRRPEISNEEYEADCALYEAKHQCMIQNNVVILRSKEVNDLTIELFQ